MKTVFPLLLISVILWGCSKSAEVTPVKPVDTIKTTVPVSAKPDSSVKLTKDDTAHMAALLFTLKKLKPMYRAKPW